MPRWLEDLLLCEAVGDERNIDLAPVYALLWKTVVLYLLVGVALHGLSSVARSRFVVQVVCVGFGIAR